jgi:hypothetical protein
MFEISLKDIFPCSVLLQKTHSDSRYYLPHEMVMSRVERLSLHPNEIFITQTTDWIDVETIQMKASIFHTKGFVGLLQFLNSDLSSNDKALHIVRVLFVTTLKPI